MRFVTAAAILFCLAPAMFYGAPASPVVISEDDSTFTLANGIVTAHAAKRSGDVTSLKYRGLEMLNTASGRQAGYWSHNTLRGQHIARITIDPKTNGGERGEVSIQGLYVQFSLLTLISRRLPRIARRIHSPHRTRSRPRRRNLKGVQQNVIFPPGSVRPGEGTDYR